MSLSLQTRLRVELSLTSLPVYSAESVSLEECFAFVAENFGADCSSFPALQRVTSQTLVLMQTDKPATRRAHEEEEGEAGEDREVRERKGQVEVVREAEVEVVRGLILDDLNTLAVVYNMLL